MVPNMVRDRKSDILEPDILEPDILEPDILSGNYLVFPSEMSAFVARVHRVSTEKMDESINESINQ